MVSSLHLVASFLFLVLAQVSLSLPITKTISRRPQSVSIFSPAAAYGGVNPLLQSKAYSNARIASALYGGSAPYPLGGQGFSSYRVGYGGMASPYGFGYQPGHVSSSYENYQTNHLGLGHAVTSKKSSSYVGNNFGYPALGGSYEHSTNVYGGVGAVYPGVYVPIGAKYGSYGSYDPYGYGGHRSYQVTPHYTKVTQTQTIPNYASVNKLRGYGK